MKATVSLDKVLDLVVEHQEVLATEIDKQSHLSSAYTELWAEYKRVSKLYDDIRRAAD